MSGGGVGKILRVNLATKSTSAIDTVKCEEFEGGFGIGAATFGDLAAALGEWDLQHAYDPRNALALMSGPLAATGVPGALCGEESSRWTSPGPPHFFDRQVPDAPGMGWYIKFLYDQGVLAPDKKIDSSPLPIKQWGELEFHEAFCDAIARRARIGDAIAEGTIEALSRKKAADTLSGRHGFGTDASIINSRFRIKKLDSVSNQ